MTTSAITSTPPVAAGDIVYAGTNPNAGRTTLGSADFMKLLTVQLTAQDPMNPMKDTEFISQMANFTSLENSRTLSESFKSFTSQQAAASAPAYLGKFVTVKDADSALGELSGLVDSVVMADGMPSLVIGGKHFDAALVTTITNAPLAALATAAN